MKKYIPTNIKLTIRIIQRFLNDLFSGRLKKMASQNDKIIAFKHKIVLKQEFKQTSSKENKIINIKLAGKEINKIIIQPQEIFSFWKIVGKPTKKKGYTKGRNLVNGNLVTGYGGGLCQLSGMIYYLALKANLEIIERYNHTVDIYTDETRFAPLGSDATVVYGFKDLRIRNNKDFPIQFNVITTSEYLLIELFSDMEIKEKNITFVKINNNSELEAHTLLENKIIQKSFYKKMGTGSNLLKIRLTAPSGRTDKNPINGFNPLPKNE